MIISAANKIVCETKKILFVPENIVSAVKKIFSSLKMIASDPTKIAFVLENIFSEPEKINSSLKKIMLAMFVRSKVHTFLLGFIA